MCNMKCFYLLNVTGNRIGTPVNSLHYKVIKNESVLGI
jgi:hypothetical protein